MIIITLKAIYFIVKKKEHLRRIDYIDKIGVKFYIAIKRIFLLYRNEFFTNQTGIFPCPWCRYLKDLMIPLFDLIIEKLQNYPKDAHIVTSNYFSIEWICDPKLLN